MPSNLSKEEAIRLVKSGMKVTDIAKMYNIATGSVYKKIRELNLREIITAETEERRLKALELYQKGWTVKQISEEIGIARTNVDEYLRSKGIDLKLRPKSRSKDQQEYSKVVEQRRIEAVRLYNEGIKVKEIAERFNTTEGRIYTYLKQKGLQLDWRKKGKEEKKALVLKYYVEEGKTKAEVLKLTGVTEHRFYKYLKEENITPREDHSYRDEMRKQQENINLETLRVFKENGESFKKTAEVLGLSSVAIRNRLKGLLEDTSKKIREQNKIKAIRLRKEGKTLKQIAKELDISIPTIRRYTQGIEPDKIDFSNLPKVKRIKKFREPTLKIKKPKLKKFTKPKIKMETNNKKKNTTRKKEPLTTPNIELSKPEEVIEEIKPKKTTSRKPKKQPKKEFVVPEATLKANPEIKKVNDVLVFPEISESVAKNMPADFVDSYTKVAEKTKNGTISSSDIDKLWKSIRTNRKIMSIIDSVFLSKIYEYIGDKAGAKRVLMEELEICQMLRNMMKKNPATNAIMEENYKKYTEETDKKEDDIQSRLYELSFEERTYTLDMEK